MDATETERLERIHDPDIRRFVEYWLSKRGGHSYPSRAALDPLEFRYVLGNVVIIEAQPPPAGSGERWRYRYRLIGANIVARDGYDLTNKTLEDMPDPEYRERVRTTWTDVCKTGIWAHHTRELFLDGRLRRYEVIVMPLASNGEDIDMLISVQREMPTAAEPPREMAL